MKDGLVRANINMSPELKDWYVKKAKTLGIAYTSLMIMAMHEYKKQEDSISAIADAVRVHDTQKALEGSKAEE